MIRCKVIRCLLACAFVASTADFTIGDDGPPSTSTAIQYQAPNGDSHFALMLAGKVTEPKTVSHDVVVLIDTSASQIGAHRRHGFAVVDALLNSLTNDNRVCLLAVDVETQRLTNGMVARDSKELKSAVRALQRRIPAGATDMALAISEAMQVVDKTRKAAIVYIGDGMSTANLIESPKLKSLMNQLVGRKVPFIGYAVGPQTDLKLLGILAQHTGGLVMFDQKEESTEEVSAVGARLAKATNSSVFYPTTISVEGIDGKLTPAVALPVRSDRHTVYLGKGTVTETATVTVTGQVNAEEITLQWRVTPKKPLSDNSYIGALWNQAQNESGLSPIAGRNMLIAARDSFDRRVDTLLAHGRQARLARDVNRAEKLALAVDQFDPGNLRGRELLAKTKRLQARLVSQVQGGAADAFADDAPSSDAPAVKDPDLVGEFEALMEIKAQKMRLEVSRTIEEARQLGTDDPDAALTLLKQADGVVRLTTDIDPDVVRQLRKRLSGVMADISIQRETRNQARLMQKEKTALKLAEKRLIDQWELDNEELETLIDRVRSLIAAGVRGNDNAYREAEEVARAANALRPGNGPATAAQFNAEAATQLNLAYRWRDLRANRWLQTLEQVEISHVPFPDEPPIRWPPAEVWKAMTEMRKKWSSVDLHKASPAEERIIAALGEETEIEFTDTPLVDAMEFLSELHNITIILDEEALREEGISPDEPLNRVLSGITLRSALKILLEEYGLTYMIQDEVMKITTIIVAEDPDNYSTRVYPVGDLVIPPQTPMSSGGGFGGGGGQQGGGQQGGQQGGGGGGGIFSVPPPKLPKKSTKKSDEQVNAVLDEILNGKKPGSVKKKR